MKTPLSAPMSAIVVVAAVLALTSCSVGEDMRKRTSDARGADASSPCHADSGGSAQECVVEGYPDRPISVSTPADAATTPLPVVIFLHGGGGNAQNAQSTTCTNGNASDATCLQGVGAREGFITVYANGYRRSSALNLRTWNAGGGDTYACASGAACADGSDDVAYLSAVIDQVESGFNADASRVYVVGFSNGAAMAHRVGCELSDRVAAIVAVSGANELGADGGCAPTSPVAVMHIHGTADACWTYDTSRKVCADRDPLPKAGVAESTDAWLDALDCESEGIESSMPDLDPADGTTTSVATFGGCRGAVEVRILTVEGGGHVYPQGAKVREPRNRSDVVTKDFGNEQIWDWLSQWSKAA